MRQWYHYLQTKGVEVRGSDHGVTRSIYFTDPDGNPFEIYCDNPDFDWRKDGLTKRARWARLAASCKLRVTSSKPQALKTLGYSILLSLSKYVGSSYA